MEKETDYEKQANDFLTKTKATIEIAYVKTDKYFDDDKEERDIYKVTMKRGTREFTFQFGQSLVKSGKNHLKAYNVASTKVFEISHKNLKGLTFNHGIHQSSEWVRNKEFQAPNNYDILSCMTKYDPGTLENFCSEFGYDLDSKKSEKTYNAVKNEYLNLCSLFDESEMEELQEIN